jgi:hypothetical protein
VGPVQERVDELAAAVPADIRTAFETAYRSWLDAVRMSPALDSSTSFLIRPPEFARLLALGPQIVPLVMQRLADPNDWVAIALADALLPQELGVEVSFDDPRALEGEQGRARRLLELWAEAS